MRDNSFPFHNTKETMERLARLIERDLKEQVPQPGYRMLRRGDKGPTGRLKQSLRVDAYPEKNDEWTLGVSYEMHGNYTNFGTRLPEVSSWRDKANLSIFELPAFRGYKKGTKGIRPQYWLSLSRLENKYLKQLEAGIELDFENFINTVVQNLSKP